MSQRRYPVADLYEERSSDFYRRGGRDLEFLDEGYGRSTTGGALVVRDRPREVEREEIIIDRERAPVAPSVRSRARSVERDEILIRRNERDGFRRQAEKEELDVIIRREEESRPAPRRRPREVEHDEILIRRAETDLAARAREREREEIIIRRDEARRPSRPARSVIDEHEDDIIIRRNGREVRGRDMADEHEHIHIRHRSRSRGRHESMPPPRGMPISRETEELVIRRRKERSISPSPPPPPRREIEREEIIIRRTEERARSPTPPPPPPAREPTPPPPVLEPIYRPPIHQQIHQEIITHHRHIDHGVERAYSSTPSPPPAPRIPTPPPAPPPVEKKVEETIEIDIRRGRGHHEEIKIEHDHRERTDHETALIRHRSLSAPRRRHYDDDLEEEADYYLRKQMERARVGEATNGATNDWAIVDVPPGTERVRMDGAGGSSQEVTWQRYNGVRRAKFLAGDREFDSGFGMPDRRHSPAPAAPAAPAALPARQRASDMWTEITKDLVVKDAIDAFGYEYEETEFFYYVMEYLRYEDVLQLVEFSDEIRRERRRRIREIEWEREQLRRPRHGHGYGRGHDHGHGHGHPSDRYYEHEVVIDTRRRH